MMSTCVLLGIDSGTPAVVNGDIELQNIPESAKDRYSYICIVSFKLEYPSVYTCCKKCLYVV